MTMKSDTLKVTMLRFCAVASDEQVTSFPPFTLSVENDSHLIVSTSKTNGASF